MIKPWMLLVLAIAIQLIAMLCDFFENLVY